MFLFIFLVNFLDADEGKKAIFSAASLALP